jgi:hypothetical protein
MSSEKQFVEKHKDRVAKLVKKLRKYEHELSSIYDECEELHKQLKRECKGTPFWNEIRFCDESISTLQDGIGGMADFAEHFAKYNLEGEALIEEFDEVYQKCAKKGRCDSLHGFQYQRIRNEWITSGYRRPVSKFIKWRASITDDSPLDAPFPKHSK